jgi:hypothetical protein
VVESLLTITVCVCVCVCEREREREREGERESLWVEVFSAVLRVYVHVSLWEKER